ncbi:hypothetical protein CBR_g5746 [Chara braunii]|uniref:Fungal lipase-like domain-containing protein n=1 Tax=Chara braunii TaxID=69332 RepID=A0A388KJB4_CHABU|nr:hypothetical protein CBR_g5746 [Chara braunii]|eukprot:GBG70116.1 hypothetical protein CBR_g5746 [Chara braunii]
MATAAMATAAGAAVLLYYYSVRGASGPWPYRMAATMPDDETLGGDCPSPSTSPSPPPSDSDGRVIKRRVVAAGGRDSSVLSPGSRSNSRNSGGIPKPALPPSTLWESLSTLAEILRFTYSETLGKWPIADLVIGINYLQRRQGNCEVVAAFAGEESVHLEGPEAVAELKELSRLLDVCLHFSKKPFLQFLEATGFSTDQVLQKEGRAGLLRPAFVVLMDKEREAVLLVIRGTHSVKDTLTAVTGSVVPFHHTVRDEVGVREIKIGYAHCGMVAAARWIARLASPVLLDVLQRQPSYRIQVVGHSLGGGTAALLTYILREKAGLTHTRCVAFAPAACMTWDLAESGEPFVTSVINGCDLVPTFSAASADDLRAEVTASAWVNDLREQLEKLRITRMVMSGAAALRGQLSNLGRASKGWYERSEVGRVARTGVAGAGALLKPVSSRTQAVALKARTMARAVPLLALSCIPPRRRSSPSSSTVAEDSSTSSTGGMSKEVEEVTEPLASPGCASRGTTSNEHALLTAAEVEQFASGNRDNLVPEIPGAAAATKASGDGVQKLATESPTLVTGEVMEEGVLSTEFERNEDEIRMVEEMVLAGEREVGDRRAGECCESGVDVLPTYVWKELQAELEMRGESSVRSPEEMEMVREMAQAEAEIADEGSSGPPISTRDVADCSSTSDWRSNDRRFFPPGRILHLVCMDVACDLKDAPPKSPPGPVQDNATEPSEVTDPEPPSQPSVERLFGCYVTPRELYGRIRLSRTMVREHYMPMYKQSIEDVISVLQRELEKVGRSMEVETGETAVRLERSLV